MLFLSGIIAFAGGVLACWRGTFQIADGDVAYGVLWAILGVLLLWLGLSILSPFPRVACVPRPPALAVC